MNKTVRRIMGYKETPVIIALLAICTFVSILSPYFMKPTNIFNVLRQISIYAIVATGQALIILTGGIDLSVGYLLGLCGVVTAILAKAGMNPVLIFCVVIALGCFVSFLSAMLITKVNINPFIATLGVQNICRGVSLLLTGGMTIMYKSSISMLGGGYLGSMPVSAIIMFLVILAGVFFTKQTLPGRNIFAVGSNLKAAKLAGVKVDSVRTMAYVISGALCALGGIVLSGTVRAAEPSAGAGYELDAIAAVVIGGTSMSGGEGSIFGVLIGAVLMGVLKNSFVLLQVSAYWQIIVLGVVIIAAVAGDSIRTRRSER